MDEHESEVQAQSESEPTEDAFAMRFNPGLERPPLPLPAAEEVPDPEPAKPVTTAHHVLHHLGVGARVRHLATGLEARCTDLDKGAGMLRVEGSTAWLQAADWEALDGFDRGPSDEQVAQEKAAEANARFTPIEEA